jgi:dienelactone hydrolase
VAGQFLGAEEGSMFREKLIEGQRYVDYHVLGYFDSPQLFERFDDDGNLLPYNHQSWPQTLGEKKVEARSERVYFHLLVPRKEVSARGDGKPAPVVIMGHGYTGNRFDAVTLGGYMARHGVAVVGIDCVSHGLSFSNDEMEQVRPIMELFGLGPLLDGVAQLNRALDLNGDGRRDSGGDFWSSYLFHTRDVVRQSALDYMQLTRIFKAFDGVTRWNMDVDGDGTNELAGDFDADGVVDVGGSAHIGITGASLGGIMASYVGAIEPNITVAVPIAGGGGLGDVGNRSIQGGVREAVHLRVMGPLYVGTQAPDAEMMTVETLIPDLNDDAQRTLAWVKNVKAGDVLLVDNLANGERGCGIVWDDEGTLRLRTAAASDVDDATTLRFFPAKSLVLGSTECELVDGAVAYRTIDRFENEFEFQGRLHQRHEPLVAIAEGLGLRRANPELRRFMALGQMVLDGGDPAAVAPYMQTNPIYYSATDQTSGAHTLIVTTGGDMNVPANTGISVGRATGLIEYFKADPRYEGTEHEGKPQGQILIDTHQAEAVEAMMRYTNSAGEGVLMDVENFSDDKDLWAGEIQRLDPPLRAGFGKKDILGGYSAAIFPFPQPTGAHGFEMPGGFSDTFRKRCEAECVEDDCGCDTLDPEEHFDIGNFMFNMMGRYMATNGQELHDDKCMSSDTCAFIPPPPPAR